MIWFFLFFIVVNGRLHLIILFCFIRITRIIKTHRQHLILISVLPSKYRYFSDKKEWNNRIGYSLAGRLRIRIRRKRRRCLRLFKRFWTGSRVSSGRRKWSWRSSACSFPARPRLSTSLPYVSMFVRPTAPGARLCVDHICTLRWAVRSVHRGHDTDRGLQHAQDHQGQRDHQAVGHWRSAEIPYHVGAVLPRSQRHYVSLLACVEQVHLAFLTFTRPFQDTWWTLLTRKPLALPKPNCIIFSISPNCKVGQRLANLGVFFSTVSHVFGCLRSTGIPVLVLGNKRDLPNALDEKKLLEEL